MGLVARIALTTAMLAFGCGGGESGGDDASATPQSGGGSASGGSSGNASGATGGGDSGNSGSDQTPQTCDVKEGRVSVDDMLFTFPLIRPPNISSANDNTELWAWSAAIGDYGSLRMVGSDAIMGEMGQPLDGSPLTIDHALLAPNVGETLGVMYGVAPGSGSQLLRQGDQIEVRLESVATLHDCGEFPAEGELDLCHRTDGSACPGEAQGGTLEGYDWTDEVTSWTLMDGDLRASVGSQGASLRASIDPGGAGPIQWAYMSTSIYGRYEGMVLCAGQGSEVVTMSDASGDYTLLHLRNLAWLEGPGGGRASGCLR